MFPVVPSISTRVPAANDVAITFTSRAFAGTLTTYACVVPVNPGSSRAASFTNPSSVSPWWSTSSSSPRSRLPRSGARASTFKNPNVGAFAVMSVDLSFNRRRRPTTSADADANQRGRRPRVVGAWSSTRSSRSVVVVVSHRRRRGRIRVCNIM